MVKKSQNIQKRATNERKASLQFISKYSQAKKKFGKVVNMIRKTNQLSIRPKGKYLKQLFDQLLYVAYLRLIRLENGEEFLWSSEHDKIMIRILNNEKFKEFMNLIDKGKPKAAFASISIKFIQKDYIRRLTDIIIKYQKIMSALPVDPTHIADSFVATQ